jgi:hypothetical protein
MNIACVLFKEHLRTTSTVSGNAGNAGSVLINDRFHVSPRSLFDRKPNPEGIPLFSPGLRVGEQRGDMVFEEKSVQNGARHSCRFNLDRGSVFDDFWSCPAEAACRPRPFVTGPCSRTAWFRLRRFPTRSKSNCRCRHRN